MRKINSLKELMVHNNVPSSSKIKAPFVAVLIGSSLLTLNSFAEGSRNFYPTNDPTTQGYRTFLNARNVTFNTAAAFDPYPNLGIHKVYLKAGEKVHMGSSASGLTLSPTTGYIKLRKPNGTLATEINSSGSSIGRIFNRSQELAGPNIEGSAPSGYTPLSYTVLLGEEGIYEVEFGALGNGTNFVDSSIFLANATYWSQPVYSGASGMIAAWDVTVTSTTNTVIPGRVYMTVFNGTGPNNMFKTESFYAKMYVLTPESYIYLVDNNGQNGASFNFFSNNKGIVSTSGDFSSAPSYASFNSTTVTTLNNFIWDPRQAEGSGNFTNKIFYSTPDLENFPATAPVHYSRVATPHTGVTWLKGIPTEPEISRLVASCGGVIRFVSNVEGHYQILIDGDSDGKYESVADRIISGNTVMGENEIVWDGKNGLGVDMGTGTISIKVRITTAEVHFPFLDMEANEHGILISRVGNPDADTVFWNDNSITSVSPDHNPSFVQASSPKINYGGIKSSVNGHKWGTVEAGLTGEQPHFYGNNKTLDTWTFVFGEAVANTNYIACISISGSVWNDVNNDGNNASEANVSGNGTSSGGSVVLGAGSTLYAYLIDEDNRVIDRVVVNADGTYVLNIVPPNTSGMKLSISTELVRFGTLFTDSELPEGWVNTKENVGSSNTASQSANNDFIIEINTLTSSINNQNFGIQQIPEVDNQTLTSQPNPGGTNTYTVPDGSFISSDFNGGFVDSIRIVSFPTNITSIQLGTTTYYADAASIPSSCADCEVFPIGGIILKVDTDGNPLVDIKIDPINGGVSVNIPFVAIDNGGAESDPSALGNVIIPFTPSYTLSGNVLNDGNGLTNDTVDGDPLNEDLGLKAILVDASNNVVAITTIDPSTGNYSFQNVDNGDYYVILTSADVSDIEAGDNVASVTVSLPNGWVHTGEHLGTNEGSDAIVNGILTSINVNNADIINANFGIQELPFSNDQSLNIGGAPVVGTPFVLVNTLSGNDSEDTDGEDVVWSAKPIIITALPTNGFKIYYDGEELGIGDVIDSYDPSLLTMAATKTTPDTAKITVFEYKVIDEAGFESVEPAVYVVTFDKALSIYLKSFDVTLNNKIVVLSWITNKEQNLNGFGIERSVDGSNWINIAVVNAKSDNNQSEFSYHYNDVNPNMGTNLYRLKMIEKDNSSSYSDVRKVTLEHSTSKVSLYPNPTSQQLTIDGLSGNETIKIINVLGVQVLEVKATSSIMNINIQEFNAGIYTIQIIGNNSVITEKVIKK